MQEKIDPLAGAIRNVVQAGPEVRHEAACEAIAPWLLREVPPLDEDVALASLASFCSKVLGKLLAEHGHDPVACAKVIRSNFNRFLRWRQRDAWRRDARRRHAESEFAAEQVRGAYEVGTEVQAATVLRTTAELDPELAVLLPDAGDVRSLDEMYGKLAAALRCSKATARRRLLALGRRLRSLMRQDIGRFLAERPAMHLPSASGVCAARVVRSVLAAA